ncbi:hypothetical protein GW17_00049447, partial [Ensete ventricosum]
ALTLSFTLLCCRRRRRCPYAGSGAARCGRQPPCQGVATPVAGTVAPASDNPLWAGHRRPSLAGAPLAAAPVGGCPLQVADSPLAGGPWLQPAAPAGGVGRSRLPLAASHGQPLLAVLAANALNDSMRFNLITRSLKPIFRTKTLALIPLLGNLQRRSYIPVFQIRIEKMKEVKRPPL